MDISIKPWLKGMNNRVSIHELISDEGQVNVCRNAVNIDFSTRGKTRRRKGFTKVYSALNAKGGYSCPAGNYFIEQGSLKCFNTNNTATILRQGIIGTEFAFHYADGIVYFSDGIISLKIINNVVLPWGISNPPAPLLTGISGSFGSGAYLAALCWVDSNGVESGASDFISISLPDNTGIKFFNLPSNQEGAVILRLYLSMPDGKELYHVADVAPGTIEYSISSGRYDDSATLEHLLVSKPPTGRIIKSYKGRIYVADSLGVVRYSDPFEYSHFRESNYLLFPSAVDIMEPVTDGIFFAFGNQTVFYSGVPETGFTIIDKFNYGGVYNTGKKVPNSENVCWQSQRGMVISGPGGQCKNIQEENVVTESANFGATLIREQDGLIQFIASLHQPTVSKLAAKSFIEAEIIRRGA